jgi:CheY-like chemotaxis protein
MNAIATTSPIQLLHLEDSEIDHQLVVRALRKQGMSFGIQRVESLADFEAQAGGHVFDLILADYRLPGFTAIDAWEALQRLPHQPPFVLLSGAIGEAAAVDAIRLGFSDYLLKDDINKLAHVIERAIEVRETRRPRSAPMPNWRPPSAAWPNWPNTCRSPSSASAPPSRARSMTTSAARWPRCTWTSPGSGAT